MNVWAETTSQCCFWSQRSYGWHDWERYL